MAREQAHLEATRKPCRAQGGPENGFPDSREGRKKKKISKCDVKLLGGATQASGTMRTFTNYLGGRTVALGGVRGSGGGSSARRTSLKNWERASRLPSERRKKEAWTRHQDGGIFGHPVVRTGATLSPKVIKGVKEFSSKRLHESKAERLELNPLSVRGRSLLPAGKKTRNKPV